jgi:hypothetical protein
MWIFFIKNDVDNEIFLKHLKGKKQSISELKEI